MSSGYVWYVPYRLKGRVLTEKPLHVRVAEALGWTELHWFDPRDRGGTLPRDTNDGWWSGRPSDGTWPSWASPKDSKYVSVLHYDIDPAAYLPLIAQYGMSIHPILVTEAGRVPKVIGWEARSMTHREWATSETLGEAVCYAVLAAEGRK